MKKVLLSLCLVLLTCSLIQAQQYTLLNVNASYSSPPGIITGTYHTVRTYIWQQDDTGTWIRWSYTDIVPTWSGGQLLPMSIFKNRPGIVYISSDTSILNDSQLDFWMCWFKYQFVKTFTGGTNISITVTPNWEKVAYTGW